MDELERIKLKKMKELEQRIQKQHEIQEQALKLDLEKKRLMNKICEPQAYEYLSKLHQDKAEIAKLIEDLLMRAFIMGKLASKISRLHLIALERKIEGKGPEIKVKRRGKELADFSSELIKDE